MAAEQGERIAQARRRTGLTQREFALQIGKSESLISKLEQGDRELNDVRLARSIAEFSGVRLAWLLGLDNSPTEGRQLRTSPTTRSSTATVGEPNSEEWSEMLRRTFVLGGLASTLSTVASTNGQVTPDLTADMRAVSASYRRAYRTAPALGLYSAAHEHMQLALSLVPGDQNPKARKELLATVGEMAVLAATVSGINLDRWLNVGPYLEIAYRAAREASDTELETIVLACRAFHAAYGMRDKQLGLDFAEAAVTASRRGATPTSRAWVAAVASERHADLGDEASSLQRLDQARVALEGSTDGQWSGIGAFDACKLTAYEGGNFGRLGRYDDAIQVLDRALSTLDPAMRRHRCTALIDRAEAHHNAETVDASCVDASAALELAVETQHADTVKRVEAVARAALPRHTNEARHLWQDVLAAKATTMVAGK